MSSALYACAVAAEFPVQTLLRLHPELKSVPAAVLDGKAPQQYVCSLNRHARQAGAEYRMTKLEAEAIRQLRLSPRSHQSEAAAYAVMLECAANFSPRIEDASADAQRDAARACVLDISGAGRLFGPPETLARRLREALHAAGFRASIAVSNNYHTARMKAGSSTGITVIPAGAEAESLAKLPIAALHLEPDDAETFAIWGIRTLGELALLPEVDLVTRMGQRALQYRALACGELPHTFQPIEPKFALEEFCDFESPVDQADSLLFVAARMIDCLVSRATARALSLASLTLRMALEGGRVHEREIKPALPSIDRKFLLKLLQLEIAAHPPQAAVVSLTLAAQAGQSSKVQLGLFVPPTPEPSRLDVTIARLKAIAGDGRVGSPRLEDSHRPDAFRMQSFAVGSASDAIETGSPRMALRRMRPPQPVRVTLREMRPSAFRDGNRTYEVDAAYGPWKTSGCWWSEESWDAEEWDVLAHAGSARLACLLVRDCTRDLWRLEAMYD